MATVAAGVDIFTAEVIRNGLATASLEMSKTLARTAHSTLLYDVQDFGVGVTDRDGAIWGEAPGISIFTGCLSGVIRGAVARHGHAGFNEGDVLAVNDPYQTGTHVSDTSIYVPAFADDELVAFAIATAHWADVGAKSPGGWCPDTTDVYQEGLCLAHQKLFVAGVRAEAVWEIIESNVRLPPTVEGDLEAQIAACRLGASRIQALCAKYGVATVRAAMAQTIARTDEAVRREILALPDGVYRASVAMDSDGVTEGFHPEIHVAVAIDGDSIHVSFDGSSPAAAGPINLPLIGTTADVRVALKALLMPFDRTNEGHFLAIEVDASPGLLVSAERPSPCDSYGYVSGAVGELVLHALAQVAPERAPAGGLQLLAVFLSRTNERDGRPFMFIEPVHGGQGASAKGDGGTLARFHDGDASNTSSEVLELRYPIRCDRFEFLPGVAGAGKHRGGFGIRRDYRVVERGVFLQSANENTTDVLARGLAGGGNACPSTVVLRPGTSYERELKHRVSSVGPLEPGDIVSLRTGGGGGWGPPLERDPDLVLQDVRDELLGADEALAIYGVALVERFDGSLRVDRDATMTTRAALATS
jgi:N-methylhydantoinase B